MEHEDRRRIEFRAGLAVGLAGAATVLLPTAVAAELTHADTWPTAAVAVPGALLLLAVLGATGWWVDSVRLWWGIDHWVHRFRSAAAWLIPFVNVFAIPQEAQVLLDRSRRPEWMHRAWVLGWVVCVALSWFDFTAGRVVSTFLFAALPLVLVLVSMQSLRAEWRRRDDADRTDGAAHFG